MKLHEKRSVMNPKVNAWLDTLSGKKILVLGLGVSNRPLVRILLRRGLDVTGCDATPYEKLDDEILALERDGCHLRTGPDYLKDLDGDVVFRTPGLHPNRPELLSLKHSGAVITSEMEAFFRVCPCRIIAVTGSDGKTTTTTLIAEFLKQAGKRVWLGGNIGTPLLPLADQMEPDDSEAPGKVLEFSRQSVPELGAYANDGVLLWSKHEFRTLIMPQSDIVLPGLHNVENYLAAICAVHPFVSVRDIRTVAQNFAGVEHRIELVRVKDGIRFYNDSIASSPSRTIACLKCFPDKIILIAGGYDKHIPYDVLGPEICEHVKLLVLTGATAPKIREAVLSCGSARRSCPEILEIDDFTEAVKAAAARAKAGDAVILSPASAAFDKFKNFMVRGRFFKDLVNKL